MSVDQITTHSSDAIKRLMEQYKGKTNITSIISIYADQIQELEDAIFPLFDALNISTQSGQFLDYIGEIVGEDRAGNTDARYRVLLLVRIGKNISNGEPKRVIDIFKLLTESEYVQYHNLNDAQIAITGTKDLTDQDEINDLFDDMQEVVAGGVRVNYFICADPDEPFAFAGAGPSALGFDDGSGTVGGLFATNYTKKLPFAFAGEDEGADGFGAGTEDPLVGGVFVS